MSDIAGWLGYLGPAAPIPYCAGHEPVGVVVGLSDNPVPNFKIGDRVGFMPASKTCQDCRACVSGNQRYCPSRINVGFNGPFGGFSEYALADPVSTVKIPNEIPDDQAAPFLCAGVTAYSAVKKVASRIPGGSLVNIVGSGGVGHLAIQYAVAMGYTVQACQSPPCMSQQPSILKMLIISQLILLKTSWSSPSSAALRLLSMAVTKTP